MNGIFFELKKVLKAGLLCFCLFVLCGCAKSEEEIVDFGRVDIVKLITPVMECYDYNLIIEDDEVADSEDAAVEETKEDAATEPPKDDKVYFNPDEPMHGVWVASVLNIDYPKTRTGNAEALKSQADEIINNCAKMGINNIFLQVRPCSDAFYKSDIFPTSKYLTGAQGKDPDGDFDCLEYWIYKCHENNIALHAWINPYRITKENESLDSALRRFKRNCAKAGIQQEIRKREHYEKPSVKRKKKSEAARKRKY